MCVLFVVTNVLCAVLTVVWRNNMADVIERLIRSFLDDEQNCRQTTYAYRTTRSGQLLRPYLFRSTGIIEDDSELLSILRDEYGTGEYRIFIRDGSRMVFSGDVGVERPRNHQYV